MPLTNAMRDFLVQAAVGEAVTPFNATNAYIGVGDGTAVRAVGSKTGAGPKHGYD